MNIREEIMRRMLRGEHFSNYTALAKACGKSSGTASKVISRMISDGSLVKSDDGVTTSPGLPGSIIDARQAASYARAKRINARRNRGPGPKVECRRCGREFPAVYNPERSELQMSMEDGKPVVRRVVLRRQSLVYRLCFACRHEQNHDAAREY